MAGKKTGIEWANTVNPLPDLIPKLAKINKPKEIALMEPIPYAINGIATGDSLLWFFYIMSQLSTTRGSCINSIAKYAAENVTVLNTGNMFTPDSDLSNDDKNKVVEFIQTNEINLSSIGETLIKHYKIAGCSYLGLTMTETLGQKKISYEVFDNRSIRLLKEEPGKPRVLSINYVDDKNKGVLFYKYPFYSIDANNTLRSFVKVGDDGYWGRPDAEHAFMHWYREWQDTNFLMIQSENKFIPQVLIESEMFDPNTMELLNKKAKEEGFASYREWLNHTLTIKSGSGDAIIHTFRPTGSRPSFVHEFKPTLNEKFYETANIITREKIIEADGWSDKLLGKSVSGLGQSSIIEELLIKQPLLNRYREDVGKSISKLFNMGLAFMGYIMDRKQVKFLENVITQPVRSSETPV